MPMTESFCSFRGLRASPHATRLAEFGKRNPMEKRRSIKKYTMASTALSMISLLAGSGCSLFGIPSQRFGDVGCAAACDSGPLPPLPGKLAEWQAEKELPTAPAYPRFHPLPTRPMFASQPQVDFPHQ